MWFAVVVVVVHAIASASAAAADGSQRFLHVLSPESVRRWNPAIVVRDTAAARRAALPSSAIVAAVAAVAADRVQSRLHSFQAVVAIVIVTAAAGAIHSGSSAVNAFRGFSSSNASLAPQSPPSDIGRVRSACHWLTVLTAGKRHLGCRRGRRTAGLISV